MIVADANLIFHYVVEGESTPLAELCRRRVPIWVAPSLWRTELINALSKYGRNADEQKRLTVLEALKAVAWANALVQPAADEPTAEEVFELSRDLRISGYDAHYVAAARRLGARCVTSDDQMLERAGEQCVSIIDFATGRP